MRCGVSSGRESLSVRSQAQLGALRHKDGGFDMADQWYFSWDHHEFGPFSAAQLKGMAALGRLQPMDAVWKQGSERRVRADRIKNLFSNPKTETVLAKANNPGFSTSLQPSEKHSSYSGAKSEPWPPSASAQGTSAAQPLTLETIPDGLLLSAIAEQGDSAPPASPPVDPTIPALTKGLAKAVSGAVITSQDGEIVRYRKKCIKCGHKDSSDTVTPIQNGLTRVAFFCPTCKKLREATIEGIR